RRPDPRPGVPGVVRIPHSAPCPNPASRMLVAQEKRTGKAALRGTACILTVTAFRSTATNAQVSAPFPGPIVLQAHTRSHSSASPRGQACDVVPAEDSEAVSAAARAASGPASRRVRSPGSSSVGTPSAMALSYLEPGFSPATTKSVFFDTEDAT